MSNLFFYSALIIQIFCGVVGFLHVHKKKGYATVFDFIVNLPICCIAGIFGIILTIFNEYNIPWNKKIIIFKNQPPKSRKEKF